MNENKTNINWLIMVIVTSKITKKWSKMTNNS